MNTHRALLALAAAGGAAVLSLTTPADAAAPTRIDAEYWGVSCVTALGDGSTLFLFGGGTTDGAEGGIGGFIENADGAMTAEGQADTFSFGSTFASGIDLGGHRFEIATEVVRGASTTEQIDERDGNRWTKGTTTRTEVALPPTSASYDGEPIELDPQVCTGDINAFDVRSTNPAALIHADEDFDSEICDIDGLADGQVRITGVLPNPYVEIVLDHGGENVEKLAGDLRLRGGRGTLATDVRELYTGEVSTTAEVGLSLTTSGKTVRTTETADGITETRAVTPYREAITVAFADGRTGTATCSGIAVSTRSRIAPAH